MKKKYMFLGLILLLCGCAKNKAVIILPNGAHDTLLYVSDDDIHQDSKFAVMKSSKESVWRMSDMHMVGYVPSEGVVDTYPTSKGIWLLSYATLAPSVAK